MPELAEKQRAFLTVLGTTKELNERIVQRQKELKTRLERLAKLYKSTSDPKEREQIEDFMKRVQIQEQQIGAMRKSYIVIDQKVQEILRRDKKDTAAFGRLLDRANESLGRYERAAALHLDTVDSLIAEADALLELAS
jgi:hypothetical protein